MAKGQESDKQELDKQELMVLSVRNFPKSLHRKAKIQAAVEGISLKDLIGKAIREYLERGNHHGDV